MYSAIQNTHSEISLSIEIMNAIFKQNLFFVKEHVGYFKAASNYDIYDQNQQLLLECREPNLNWFTKLLRFSEYKRMTPFEVVVTAPSGEIVLTIKRGWTLFRSEVSVYDENNILQGRFRQRMLSIGGKFDILDENDVVQCQVKGTWTSWDFSFDKDGMQLAQVTKKWAGIGREIFTTADNYVVAIDPLVSDKNETRLLIVAAALCIDKVLKE
jgi:uncharacterized protein YxjI